MKHKTALYLTLMLLSLLPIFSGSLWADDDTGPDWNDSQIEWHDYQAGLQQACNSGKPVMLLFYADWCQTCHAYKGLFKESEIVALSKALTMIRINIDRHPEIDAAYNLDGGYVPRIFGLRGDGQLMRDIHPLTEYRYYIDAGNRSAFIKLMHNIIDAAQSSSSSLSECNA